MALRIFNNLPSISAQRFLGLNTRRLGENVGRLASGSRINKASDDATGLAISEGLRSDTRALKQGVRNLGDAKKMIGVLDGALAEQSSILIRLREIASQAATGTIGSAERGTINLEYQQLRIEFDRIGNSNEFNGIKLLDGTLAASNPTPLIVQVGLNSELDSRININLELDLEAVNSSRLNFDTLNLRTRDGALIALGTLNEAVDTLSITRANVGALQNRFEKALNNLAVSIENLTAADSRIRDNDMVEDLVKLTQNEIIVEASTAMVGQANLIPQGVLQLIQS